MEPAASAATDRNRGAMAPTSIWNRPINRWWTVLAGAMGSAVGAGTIMIYSYGILAAAMGAEYGWNRDLVARNMSAFLVGSGIGTVLLGWLISRLGVRLPSGIMATAFGLLFAIVAFVPANGALHFLLFLLVGIMGGAATAMPYAVSISGTFEERRGLAIGLVVAGGGLGAAIWPPIAQLLLASHGWQSGFVVIGLVAAGVACLGFSLLVRSPPGVTQEADTPANERSGFRAYFAMPPFWKLVIPVVIVSMATFGAMTNLVSLLKDGNYSGTTIAAILSFAGAVSWVSRITVGYLLDKFYAPYICTAIFIGTAVGLILLTTQGSVLPLYVGAALLALALSSEADLITYMVSRYFRLVDYSRVIGLLWVTWAWSGSLGALAAGSSFTWTGSYRYAFYAFALMLIFAVAIILTLGPYRHTEKESSAG